MPYQMHAIVETATGAVKAERGDAGMAAWTADRLNRDAGRNLYHVETRTYGQQSDYGA